MKPFESFERFHITYYIMLNIKGVKMDNVIITKIWSDADFFEVDIKFVSEYVVITQPYYLQEYQITNIVKELLALCNFRACSH